MIKIEKWGSFEQGEFKTSAEEGGHVAALKRAIQYLTEQLGPAVILDAQITVDNVVPTKSPLGTDL